MQGRAVAWRQRNHVGTRAAARPGAFRTAPSARGAPGRRRHLQRIQPPCQPTDGPPDAVSARIAQHVRGRSASDAEEQSVISEVQRVHAMLQQSKRLPAACPDPPSLAAALVRVADIVAAKSDYEALQMLRRHPELLDLDAATLATRTLQLKLLLPQTDIAALIWQRPSLLLLPDVRGAVEPALLKMRALMPGISFEHRLHEGGTAFWSFVSLLPDQRTAAAARTADCANDVIVNDARDD